MKLRMQAPDGAVSVCWQGNVLDVAEDGTFLCPFEAHDELTSHGCIAVGQFDADAATLPPAETDEEKAAREATEAAAQADAEAAAAAAAQADAGKKSKK